MLTYFRISSFLEGISYLVILCVSLNIISRELVYIIGMTHGALFVVYFVLSLIASHKQGWSVVVWLLVFLAAVVPFAFLLVELFLKKEFRKEQLKAAELANSD